MLGHGMDERGIYVPRGVYTPKGRFGRLFPTLESRLPTGLPVAEQFGLAKGLMDAGLEDPAHDSKTMAAGFTFFAQFLDHDITFDPTSSLERQTDPIALSNFRTPSFDLDNLYGSGPTASLHLYSQQPIDGDRRLAGIKLLENGHDLARNSDVDGSTALIGDPRNDENMLLSQLQLAFIKFHNAVVDGLRHQTITDVFGSKLLAAPADPPLPVPDPMRLAPSYSDTLFFKAQQLVRWHCQWIIVHEFLPLVCAEEILEDIEEHGPKIYSGYYAGGEDVDEEPFIPVEFSVAAYRFGHATIRSEYKVNDTFTASLFPTDPGAPPHKPRTDLRGGPVAPENAVKWSNFFFTDAAHLPQFAKRIEPRLNTLLLDLPDGIVPHGIPASLRSLAVRNLLRSESLELPSGQDVARKLGEVPLTDEQLGLTDKKFGTPGSTYLWYYILREAELQTGGATLGRVGSRIVAEVFLGLLDGDSLSYRSAYPIWKPTLPSSTPGDFKIADLLSFAGVL